MITNYLIRKATNGNTDYKNKEIRLKLGYLASVIGVLINILLFIIKLSIGLLTSSIAILADAFNNLSDVAASLITIIGFKLSSMPADKQHPYGHGRLEYISASIVATLVMVVGFQFVRTSVERIINPKTVIFEWIPFIILCISILFKIWLSRFNIRLGNKISSSALKASGTDALGDVFTTLVVTISLLASKFTNFNIDGYIGIIVSVFILLAGFGIFKDTMSQLIGEYPDEEIINGITKSLLSYDYIIGVHDLIIHNYGPGRMMGSVDVEIPPYIDIITIHDIIDKAERELGDEFNLKLVIHMDPVGFESKEVTEIRNEVKHIVKLRESLKSFHDLVLIEDFHKKSIVFDLVVDGNIIDNIDKENIIIDEVISQLNSFNNEYEYSVRLDKEYF